MCMQATHPRQTRLQRECEVSSAPAVLLAAACIVLVLVLGVDMVLDAVLPAPARALVQAATPVAPRP